MRYTRSARLAAALGAAALLAAACGGGEEEVQPPESPTTPAETTPEIPTELAGLRVIDDLTFEVELKNADPVFPAKLGYAAYYPLPKAFFDDPQAFDEQPIGNGPFRLTGPWEHDVQIQTEAYPDYAGEDKPNAPGITFSIYADINTAYNDLVAGNLDVMDSLPPEQVDAARQQFGDRFGNSPSSSINYIGFPFYVDWLADNPALRAALSMAIDRQAITDAIFNGTRAPAFSFVNPVIPGHRPNVCDNWNYDPDGAKAKFAEAGGLDALPDTITIWFNSGAGHDAWIEAVKNQWVNVLGIPDERFAFEQLEFSEYLPLLDEQGLTGPFRLGWGMDYPFIDNYLVPLFATASHPPAGSNNTFYSNPEFDQLIEQAAQTAAEQGLDAAIPIYQQAEDIICRDTVVAPMFYGQNFFAWNDTVSGVYVDAFGDINYTEIQADQPFSTYIGEPEHLTPTNSNESEGIAVLRAIFKGLVDYDPRTTETRLVVAESITSDDGGKTWTIKLKDGWTFHNGEPVTAQSFVDAWNYGAYGPNGQANNSFYSNIVGYDEMNPAEE